MYIYKTKQNKKTILKLSVYHSFNQTEAKRVIKVCKSQKHFSYYSHAIYINV